MIEIFSVAWMMGSAATWLYQQYFYENADLVECLFWPIWLVIKLFE